MKRKESQLLSFIEDSMDGIDAICELKDTKNAEAGLFGVNKKTEQEYMFILNRAKQNLIAVILFY